MPPLLLLVLLLLLLLLFLLLLLLLFGRSRLGGPFAELPMQELLLVNEISEADVGNLLSEVRVVDEKVQHSQRVRVRDKPRVLRALEVLQILQKAEKRGVVQVSTLR